MKLINLQILIQSIDSKHSSSFKDEKTLNQDKNCNYKHILLIRKKL